MNILLINIFHNRFENLNVTLRNYFLDFVIFISCIFFIVIQLKINKLLHKI
jgi:hypothetical protein